MYQFALLKCTCRIAWCVVVWIVDFLATCVYLYHVDYEFEEAYEVEEVMSLSSDLK